MERGQIMKVGVIGTGSMGENHVRTYASLQDYCELVGIFDNNEKRAQRIAAKYETKMFSTVEDLLEAVDLVTIAVPTKYHYEIGLACIRHNVHMLMEKPIASSVAEARSLLDEANEAGVLIQVGHIELYNPIISMLKNILQYEKVIAFDVHRMNPFDPRLRNVDVVEDLMIHDLYILRELFNDEISDVYAIGKDIEGTQKHAVALLKFESGVIAQLTASFKSEKRIRTIRIITEDSLIIASLLENKLEIIRPLKHYVDKDFSNNNQKITEYIDIPPIEPLKFQIIDFIECVKNGSIPFVTGEDGIKALTLCNKISAFIENPTNE